jgi:hypothetical protein
MSQQKDKGNAAWIENGLKHKVLFDRGFEAMGGCSEATWSDPMRVRYMNIIIDPVGKTTGCGGAGKRKVSWFTESVAGVFVF